MIKITKLLKINNVLNQLKLALKIGRINKSSLKKFQIYQSIKARNNNLSRQKQIQWTNNQKYKCEGCNTSLQFDDSKRYGFIDYNKFQKSIQANKNLLNQSYGEKIKNLDSKALDIMHEVQNQTGVKIFNNQTKSIQNLDNLNVLMRIQDKVDQYEEQEQFLRRSKALRKQILCNRCYSLKHHNRLPSEYDDPSLEKNNQEKYILDRIFTKHKGQDVQYFYVLDILDVAGSFQFSTFQRLIKENVTFSIVASKLDIVNKKYLNHERLFRRIRNKLDEYFQKLSLSNHEKVKVFFLSNVSKDGIKKLKLHIEENDRKKIQLIGYPNVGKTSLLNVLTHLKKTISKIPGTTTKTSEHLYKKRFLIYDMPGIYLNHLLYNLIQKPSLKALLTWNKFYSPPLLTHRAYFFGGKVEIQGVRIIIFGHGGACSYDNKWFLLNYLQFWKGLPDLTTLEIVRYERQLNFINGKTQDLQIQGFGFISFRLCQRINQKTKKLIFYLPKIVRFNFSQSVLSDDSVIHFESAQVKKHMLQRLWKKPELNSQE